MTCFPYGGPQQRNSDDMGLPARTSGMTEHEELIALRKYAHEVTRALTNLTGGGSEMFDGQIGEMFKADLHFCTTRIRERHDRLHNMWAAEARKRKQLEEELAAVARNAVEA